MTVRKKNAIFYAIITICIVILLILIGAVSSGTFTDNEKLTTLIKDEGMNSLSLPISAVEITKEKEVLQDQINELEKQLKTYENDNKKLNDEINKKNEEINRTNKLISAYILYTNDDTESANNILEEIDYNSLNDTNKSLYELIK